MGGKAGKVGADRGVSFKTTGLDGCKGKDCRGRSA